MTARLALVVACVLTACTNDYDKFEVVNDGQDSGLGGTGVSCPVGVSAQG